MNCRHCGAEVRLPFIDLGTAPPSNAYLVDEQLDSPETWFPLRVMVCERCWLVQTEDYAHHEQLFSNDYAYFSSYSTSWLRHAERYVADAVERFGLNSSSLVVEVASNDGYLLQYVKARSIACLGIEPTSSTAAAARSLGINVVEEFFGTALAKRLKSQGYAADLMVANNVLAHVPNINEFVEGFAELLKPHGVATFEFPHLMRLVQQCQFDTVYHEHFSYLSLTAVKRIVEANGLSIFDIQELDTHGGSLRVFAQRADTGPHKLSPSVLSMMESEATVGMRSKEYYLGFQTRANAVKDDLLVFLLHAKKQGTRVGAYGAAAKGNTLLNYAGVKRDLVPWVIDRNPAKQGKCLPGSRIPVVSESVLMTEKPEFVLILPWNLNREIVEQLDYIRSWGGKFVTAIPELSIQ